MQEARREWKEAVMFCVTLGVLGLHADRCLPARARIVSSVRSVRSVRGHAEEERERVGVTAH